MNINSAHFTFCGHVGLVTGNTLYATYSRSPYLGSQLSRAVIDLHIAETFNVTHSLTGCLNPNLRTLASYMILVILPVPTGISRSVVAPNRIHILLQFPHGWKN